MARSNKLTKTDVQTELRRHVEKPRVVSDGNGLYLRLRPDGTASWFFASMTGGRRRELGLGNARTVDLGTARDLADDHRIAIAKGRDPFAERAAAKRETKEAVKVQTFGAFAEDYIASVETGWKNEKHRNQWKSSLREHASGIWKRRIDEIGTDDVLDVLRPIWTSKPETASRVRGRIEKVLSAAKVKGLRPRDSFNPATWRGHLDILLPRQPRLSRGHHAALPFKEAPEFMAKLRARPAMAARALEFTILTAARTGEAINAVWRELDLEAKIWTVPASRMKAAVEHRVPLSTAAVSLLKAIRPNEAQPDALVFGELSNMAMAMLLRRLDVDVTVHGFRSTFRDWAGEETEHAREVIEQALAHTIQNKAERAYRRQTAVEKRRRLMEDWAAYVASPAGAN
ncbi:MAG TPA: integrase arm-type DNA-binding domain-containing protein [Sphingomicrobium sp.]